MPSKLYKHGRYWCFPYWEGRGEGRRQRWYNTKKDRYSEAVTEQANFYAKLHSTDSGATLKESTWPVFVEAYLTYSRANKRPRSVKRDAVTIRTFDAICPISRFKELTFAKLEEYKSKRISAGIAESSINRELSTLKNMGRMSVSFGYADKNPVLDVKKYTIDNTGNDRFLNEQEAKRLIDNLESRTLKTACMFGLKAATRIGEAVHMTWDDIAFDDGLVHFTSKDGWKVKTKHKQSVPLNEELREYLEKLPRHGKYVCAYENGDIPSPETAGVLITRRMKDLGIYGATSHTLRHTCLSWAAMTMPWLMVVRLARHTNPAMTMRYAHLSPEFKNESINRLPRILGNKKANI